MRKSKEKIKKKKKLFDVTQMHGSVQKGWDQF